MAILIRLLIVLALLFFGAFSSCNSALRQKARGDREMATRLALEERMSKFALDRSTLEEKAKAKEKEAEELKAVLENTNKSLVQEQLINQSLKEELQKVVKLKEALEDNLKQIKENEKTLK